MDIIAWIAMGVFAGVAFYFYKASKVRVQLNKKIEQQNEKLAEINKSLFAENNQLEEVKNKLLQDRYIIEVEIKTLQNNLDNQQSAMKDLANSAYSNYCDLLEKSYEKKNKEYDNLINNLTVIYNNKQDELQEKYKQQNEILFNELNNIRKTRDAAISAHMRELEIQEQLSFYCLTPSERDINDIQTLEAVKIKLFNPRILSMLIWSTYFQKDMTNLCNRVLGTKTITGIYKITNQKNKMCYIGQSVDVAKRWKDHAKCGLGIDTPQGNKLYKDIQSVGIWNFSWELLEECPREQLNDKEKYYIDLYQSKEFGYNSTKGNN